VSYGHRGYRRSLAMPAGPACSQGIVLMELSRSCGRQRARAWIAPAAAGALAVTGGAASAPACQLVEIGEFHISLDGTRPLVTAEIKGHSVRMLVDSGSDTSLLWRQTAAALDLTVTPLRGVKFYGVGGGDSAGRVMLRDFTLGGYTVHNFEVIVTGHQSPSDHFVGVVGEDFLSQTDVEFDFLNRAVRLLQPKDCSGDQVVYWKQPYSLLPIASRARSHLVAHVLLNGKQVLAELDTGASATTVTEDAARRAGVRLESQGVGNVGTSHGLGPTAVETYVAVFPTLTIGDETIKNAKLGIADLFGRDKELVLGSRIPTFTIETPDMLLGADFFLSHRIYVARSQGKIYFSYVGGPVFRLKPRSPPETTPTAGTNDAGRP
jgi:predicted aspartyl protease